MIPETYGLETQVFILRQQVEALQQSDHAGSRGLDLETDFGFRGDGSDNTIAANRLVSYVVSQRGVSQAGNSHANRTSIRVRPGTYSWPADLSPELYYVELEGTDRDTCILKSSDPARLVNVGGLDRLSNLTLENFHRSGDPGLRTGRELIYRNCTFRYVGAWPGVYLLNVSAESALVENCSVRADSAYVGIWSWRGKYLTVRNCHVEGTFSHCMRFEELASGGRVEITGNHTRGGTTGIFFPSNRIAPLENVLIEGNLVEEFREEGISLDGLGNNAGLCPVIANGTIASATNAVDGRLVITPNLVYHDGTSINVACPLSLRSDWAVFRASFGEGSGMPGVVAPVKSFDAAAGTITLDLFTPASGVTLGGDFGIHAGFHGVRIIGNLLSGGYGVNYLPGSVSGATAISVYLDVFDCTVADNVIRGCGCGINIAAGRMISTYECLAYNNVVRDNRLHMVAQIVAPGCNAIRLPVTYNGRRQYGNRCRGNLVYGGQVLVQHQDDNDKVWDASNELLCGASAVKN